MKTINICITKPNETKAWFRLPFTPSHQETDQAYSTVPGVTQVYLMTENQNYGATKNTKIIKYTSVTDRTAQSLV